MLSALRASAHFMIMVLLALLVAGCVTSDSNKNSLEAAGQFVSAINASPVLAPGDVVILKVEGEGDLSGEYTIKPDGLLTLPLVQDVPVVGLTVESASKVIKAAYQKGFLVDPVVHVQKKMPPAVFVMGAVNAAGSYPYSPSSTVMKSAAMAGGFRANADLVRFDVVRAGQLIHADASTEVIAGDVIMVRMRALP
ncbi:MAG: polysaccharide export protein [Proteobacteria bacterium]|nr:polysaccharide export protein [Pseudomonadota bacterium]